MAGKQAADVVRWFGDLATLDGVARWIEQGPRTGWEAEAQCRDREAYDLFFPERGGSCRPAKTICAACPVRMDCLASALETKERDGVWGGLNTDERSRLTRALASHSTAAGAPLRGTAA